jgi:hypothetical protein
MYTGSFRELSKYITISDTCVVGYGDVTGVGYGDVWSKVDAKCEYGGLWDTSRSLHLEGADVHPTLSGRII